LKFRSEVAADSHRYNLRRGHHQVRNQEEGSLVPEQQLRETV
jgi:hypothetical protein